MTDKTKVDLLAACYDYAQTLSQPKSMKFAEFIRMASAHMEIRRSKMEQERAKELLVNIELPKQRTFTLDDLMKL